MICGRTGDVGEGPVDGVFVGDTRICDRLTLRLDGSPVVGLAVMQESPFHAALVGRGRGLLIFRDHWVGNGLRSDLRIRNLSKECRSVRVSYEVGTDLAGLFDVKEGQTTEPPVAAWLGGGAVHLGLADGMRATTVRSSPPAELAASGTLSWEVELGPHDEWECCIEVAAVRGGKEVPPAFRCGTDPRVASPALELDRWMQRLPRLSTDVDGLGQAVRRSGQALGGLRIFDPSDPSNPILAAGAPWFMTLFGRDSIIASWMALVADPGLGLSTARTLARLQGRATNRRSEEQPGRILHEVRMGASASLALDAGDLYYGSADATPLFVMLVAELRRWGTPLDALRPLLGAVDAALDWMAGPGDPDGDGYVEYQRASPTGLVNQGWKDSWDGVCFANGSPAQAPIAMAEIQGYAYAALLGGAELAAAFGRDELAEVRRERASRLWEQFNRDFWLVDQGAYALALDADKRPVDAIASNMGHLLWTGLVAPDRVEAVARWLCSPELFSGWGIRTLSTTMARYDPLSYHNGSVWPHDTAICVAGLRRAGRAAEAMQVASGLLAAAGAMGGEMPELFAGISRAEAPVPVAYPASCRPQAWACGAPLLILRSMLGLEPDVPSGVVSLDPFLPPGASRLSLEAMPLAGARVNISVAASAGGGCLAEVTGLPASVTALIGPGTLSGRSRKDDRRDWPAARAW
jgi:glycogen debranching enzyme